MDRSVRETDLLLRAIDGDTVALKLLLTESHGPLCNRISRRVSGDVQRVVDVEDIVQEAHVEVFRRIRSFEPRGPESFSRWLTAIAISRLRNAIKRHRAAKRGGGRMVRSPSDRRIEDSTIALLSALRSPEKTPSRCVARREAVDAVHSALDAIPEHYRQAVWLVHIEGRSVREAASQMGRTERAIHGLCRRGLKLLETHLQSSSRFLSSTG